MLAMKRILLISIALFTLGYLEARQRQMEHPRLDVSPIQFSESAIENVRPVQATNLQFSESVGTNSENSFTNYQHLNFGSRELTTEHFDFDTKDQFENMRMKFDRTEFQHLNFNVE